MKSGRKKVIYFIRNVQDVMRRWFNGKPNYITIVDANRSRIHYIKVIKVNKI